MRSAPGLRSRRRHVVQRWTVLSLVTLALLAGAFWFGREVGGFEEAATTAALERQLEQMEERIAQANLGRAQAERSMADALLAAQEERATLEARVPQGEFGDIVDLMRAKLDAGVPVERLRFVVEAVQRERQCDPRVEKRRFAPRLPNEVSPLQTVSFLDNRITISGAAVSAIGDEGVAQPWFDPTQPVEIRVLRIGGGIELVKGPLPTGHSVVADGREYRLVFAQTEKRGVIEVSLQDCAYP